jgi:hypothetical protein
MFSIIFTNESMILMNGSVTAKIIYDIERNKELPHTPIYILISYETFIMKEKNCIDGIISKRITKTVIKNIMDKLS